MTIEELIRAWDDFELGGPVPPPLILSEVADEIARLRREKAELVEAAMKIDRMALVIESAVRNRKDGNYSAVLFALKANEAALRSATEKGEPT